MPFLPQRRPGVVASGLTPSTKFGLEYECKLVKEIACSKLALMVGRHLEDNRAFFL